jgi:tetratricopeptide (TPR) repeat protein
MRSVKLDTGRALPIVAAVLCLALLAPEIEAGKKKKKKKKKAQTTQVEETVASSTPPPPQAVLEARAYLNAYATEKARAALDPLMSDDDPVVTTTRARVLEQEQDYEGASVELRAAADRDPSNPAALVYLGETLFHADQADKAKDAFARAERRARARVDSDPADAEALYFLGVAQQRQLRYDEAIASLERARKADPANAMIVYQLGTTRAFQERWQEAYDLLSQAISMEPGIAYAYYYRGLVAGKLDRKDILVNDMERFLAMAPRAPEADKARKIRGAA